MMNDVMIMMIMIDDSFTLKIPVSGRSGVV